VRHFDLEVKQAVVNITSKAKICHVVYRYWWISIPGNEKA